MAEAKAKKKTMTLYMDEQLWDKFIKLAESESRSRNNLVNILVENMWKQKFGEEQ